MTYMLTVHIIFSLRVHTILTLQALHSSSSTAGCWFYGPDPTPAPPGNTAATASSPAALWHSDPSSAHHLSEITKRLNTQTRTSFGLLYHQKTHVYGLYRHYRMITDTEHATRGRKAVYGSKPLLLSRTHTLGRAIYHPTQSHWHR